MVLQEGLANVCLITESMTLVRQRIEPQIPRKRRGDVTQYEKGIQKFYEQILLALVNPNHINFGVIKCLIIASPGFVKDQFKEYLIKEVSLLFTFFFPFFRFHHAFASRPFAGSFECC